MSYRRLRVLLDNAPRESAYALAVGGERALWSHTDYMLADIYDLIRDTVLWKQAPPYYRRPGSEVANTQRVGSGTVISLEEARERWPHKKGA